MIRAADLFCGAGGASTGLVRACQTLGVDLDLLAVNHWPTAVQTHLLNHPGVRHMCESVEKIDPRAVVPGGRLHLLLAGPECTHFSSARGGRPVNPQSRASAWHILKWAQELYIDTILIENVPEFRTWGPIGADFKPLKSKKGQTYRAFLAALESLGYTVEDRIINAADYGDPTTRRRLFIMARRGRHRISWPSPTHDKTGSTTLFGGLKKWKSAREIIDWSIPGKSIFGRKKPLAAATMARILSGLEKFGGPELQPFLVILRRNAAGASIDSPTPTLTAGGLHIGVAQAVILGQQSGSIARTVADPLPTIATDGAIALVEPCIVQTNERRDVRAESVDVPLKTITGMGGRCFGLAEPVIASYYGTKNVSSVSSPLPTVTTKDRFGLVQPVINGQVLDIRFRMLQHHELSAAMSFPKSYVFHGTREEIVKQIGNSWPGELSYQLNLSIAKDYAPRRRSASIKRIA